MLPIKQCPWCGQNNAAQSAFCSQCGRPFPVMQAVPGPQPRDLAHQIFTACYGMALYAACLAAFWGLFWVGAAFLANLTTRPDENSNPALFSTFFFGILGMAVIASIGSAALFALMLRRVGDIKLPAILAALAMLTVIVFPQMEGALYRPPEPEPNPWREAIQEQDRQRRERESRNTSNSPSPREWARVQPNNRAFPDGTSASVVTSRYPGGTWTEEPIYGLIYPFQYGGQVRAVVVNPSNRVVGEIYLVNN